MFLKNPRSVTAGIFSLVGDREEHHKETPRLPNGAFKFF